MTHLAIVAVLFTASSVTAAELPAGTFAAQGPGDVTWTLSFDGKQNVVVTRAGKKVAEGKYRTANNRFTIVDVKGPHAEPAAGPGKYRWQLDNGLLKFTQIEDKQQGRAKVLSGRKWKRQE